MPIVSIHILEGRTLDQKRALVAGVTKAVVEALNTKPDRVKVIVDEMSRENFASDGELYCDK